MNLINNINKNYYELYNELSINFFDNITENYTGYELKNILMPKKINIIKIKEKKENIKYKEIMKYLEMINVDIIDSNIIHIGIINFINNLSENKIKNIIENNNEYNLVLDYSFILLDEFINIFNNIT